MTHTRPSRHRSAQGFTLTEILIAVFVLSVGLLGVISLFPVGLDATARTISSVNAEVCAKSIANALRISSTDGGATLLGSFNVAEDFADTSTNRCYPYQGVPDDTNGPPRHNDNENAPYDAIMDFPDRPSYSSNVVLSAPNLTPGHVPVEVPQTNRRGIMRAQIAVYRRLDAGQFHSFPNCQFQNNTSAATITSSAAQDPAELIDDGDYVRADADGLWYKVQSVETIDATHWRVNLEETYTGASGAGAPLTATDQIIGLREAYITSRRVRK